MRKVYVFVLIILMNSNVFAQQVGLPLVKHFDRADYKGGTQSWKITQSPNGVVYVANNKGLLEYDGSDWSLFPTGSSESITRSVGYIDDRIYVSNYDELGYFDEVSSQPLRYQLLYSGAVGGEVWNIFNWQNGVLFQSDKKILVFQNDSLIVDIEAKSQFKSAHQANGMMLIHEDGVGLMELRGNKLFAIKDGERFANMLVTGIVEMSADFAIIFTMHHGMYRWDSSGIQAWNVPANALLKKYNVYTAVNYDDAAVIGTIQAGLLMINAQGEITLHLNKDQGLGNNTVLSLFVDSDNNLWCGLDNGIAHIQMNTNISYLQSYFNIGTVYAVEKFQAHYYFGTNQGLFRISEKELYNPQKSAASFEPVAGARGQVWTLRAEGNELLCGHNLGVFAFDGKKVKQLSPPEIKGAWVFRQFPNKSNQILVGTYEGLCVLRKEKDEWKYSHWVAGFKRSARFIEFDEWGKIWVTHGAGGIDRLHLDSGEVAVDSLNHYDFRVLFADAQGAVVGKLDERCVFFSNRGFYVWNQQESAFELLPKYQDYFAEYQSPNRVLKDQYQNLWYYQSGILGVLRKMEDGSYQNISRVFDELKDKLIPSFEFIYVVNDKDVMVAVEDGVAYYTSSILPDYPEDLNLNLRAFKVLSDSTVYVRSQLGGINANQEEKPVFQYAQNTFSMRYAVSNNFSGAVSYSSMLKGYDAEMSKWVSRNYREYANIPAGEYTFVAQAKDENGRMSKPIEFSFEVLPPWYWSNWSKGAYVLLLLLLIYFVYRLVNARLLQKQKEARTKQNEIHKQKEEQLKQEALEAEKEIIRLRNESLLAQMHHKEQELANITMNVVKKNDFLQEIKEDLQDLRREKQGDAKLRGMLNKLISRINADIEDDNHWDLFETHIEEVHQAFLLKLRANHADLSKREEQLATYIRMGMSSKEIASLQNISVRSVENNRSKLRTSMNLASGINLGEYLMNIEEITA